jgi:ArsR family transcriptional regulator
MKYHIFLGMEISTDEFFAAIANPIRLRCLALVVQAGELCVCELMYALELSQPMVSRHLAQLRKSGLLRDRREGHWVYYRLPENLPSWVVAIVQTTVEGIKPLAPYVTDLARLQAMPDRPGAVCCT